ncbi:MAG TPA: hypothetical protein VN372_11955 [Methanospirillum sp.]|nr:hypothetical protein [Methanospirillum sp.]
MLVKAGYMQKSKTVTIDEQGRPTEIFEVTIEGRRYGIQTEELKDALRGRFSARTFKLRSNWKQYIDVLAGIAYLSHSGKAMNFEFIDGSKYTVSLDSLKSMFASRSSYAPVARLPISSSISAHPPVGPAQRILSVA